MLRTNLESGKINLIDDRLRRLENEYSNIVVASAESVKDKCPVDYPSMKGMTKTSEGIKMILEILEGVKHSSITSVEELSGQILKQFKDDRKKEMEREMRPLEKVKDNFGKVEVQGKPDDFKGRNSEEENEMEKEFSEEFLDSPQPKTTQPTLTQFTQMVKKKAHPGLPLSQKDKKIKGKGTNKFI